MMPATAPMNTPSTFSPEAAFEDAGLVEVLEAEPVALDNTELMELRIGWVEVPVPDDAAELEEPLAAPVADDTTDDTCEFIEDRTEDTALPL